MTTVERQLLFTGKDLLVWVVVFGGAALALAVYLYRVERHQINRRLGTLLVVLRVLVIALILIALLEPVISIIETTTHKSTVLVMVDVSHSMMIPDSTLKPGETLGIAYALGRLPEGVSTSPLSSSADDLDSSASALNAAVLDWQRLTDSFALQDARSKPLLARFDLLVKELSDWQHAAKSSVASLETRSSSVSASPDLESRLRQTVQKLQQEVLAQTDRTIGDLTAGDFRSIIDVPALDRLTRQLEHIAGALSESVALLRGLAEEHNDLIASRLSGSVRQELDKTAQSTRFELVEQMLAARSAQLPKDLAKKYDVVFRTFAGGISGPLSPSPEGVVNLTPADSQKNLAPDFTDLATNLNQALADLSDKKIAAVVVVSDGCFNRGNDPASLVPELAKRHIPLHTVAMGAGHPPRDLALVAVEGPDTLFENDRAVISAVVQGVGFDGQSATVTLREGETVLATQTVPLKDSTPRQAVALAYTPSDIGEHSLDVVVEPLPGELIPDNNRASLVVRVVKDKNRILLVDGEPRWEYRFLRNALLRDNRIDLTALLFQPVVLSGDEPARSRKDFPDDRAKLSAFDVLVFGDVNPDDLSSDQLHMIESFVADRGGTLVVVAGRNFMPDRYKGTVFDAILPVVPQPHPGGVVVPDGYVFSPTQEGASSDMLKMSVDPAENETIWKDFPLFYWYYPVAQPKPGSTVLAECKTSESKSAPESAPSPEAGKPASTALLVEQSYGLGKVLWIGTDSTWRWRYKNADKYHYRFWGQVIRWATSRSLPAGIDTVRFGTDKGRYQEGQDVSICARVLSDDLKPVSDARVEAVVLRETEPGKIDLAQEVARLPLSYVTSSGGRYEAVLTHVATGRYHVKLSVPGREEALKNVFSSFDVASAPIRELADLAANRPLMARLASGTGGRTYRPWELPDLSKRLPDVTWTEKKTYPTPLWHHWYLLIAFSILVATEWVVRKRTGLL